MELKHIRSTVSKLLGLILTLYTIFAVWTVYLQPMVQVTLFFSLSFAVVFISRPILGKKDSLFSFSLDILLALIVLGIGVYVMVDYDELVYRAGMPTTLDTIVNILGVLLTFEVARRTIGSAMIIIAIIFILYGFFGQYLFPPLSHGGYDVIRVLSMLFLSENGILGVPMGVMFNFIYLFIVFGALYGSAGGTRFFIDLTRSLFAGLVGGPAKVAVVSSGLMGTISGSAVANVVTTGTFTIPMMKKVGFEPHVAGAVEAVASTGGQLMPPIMGAAAFVMADYLNVPYISIVKAAIVPAIIYYVAIFVFVHLYSMKLGIKREKPEDLRPAKEVLKDFWIFLPPLGVLIFFLVAGYTPSMVVIYTLIAVFIMSLFKKEFRLGPKKLFEGMSSAATESVSVTSACAMAGVIIAIVLLTGLGVKIGNFVLYFSKGHLYLALPFIMIASLVLGMGLPTVVCYILLAVTTAPPIIKMGVDPMAAHLFIFYFGMLSMVTPPVGMAFYAGAALAGAPTMKTGWTAWKIALAGFLLPFMFVYSPALILKGNPLEVALASISALIGATALSASVVGYFKGELSWFKRVMAFCAALFLIKPGWITDVIGLVLMILIWVAQRKKEGR
ncbi:MAG: TRAP transporter permease [Syntrophorhabdaceae bacterium]|nr:TRAP transporter permease [Syntrophorhabdaceae bacterium]